MNIIYKMCDHDGTLAKMDNGLFYCQICLEVVELFDFEPCYKDFQRTTFKCNPKYTSLIHFNRAIQRYQGLQKTDEVDVEHALNMIKHHLIESNMDVANISKDWLYAFLKRRRLSKQYVNLNLLYFRLTKKPCPNISTLVKQLEHCYICLERTLHPGVKSANYILFKLLQHLGYPCHFKEFYVLKTKCKLVENECRMKIAFDQLGWLWTPIL